MVSLRGMPVFLGASLGCLGVTGHASTCPGIVDVRGYGQIALVNAEWDLPSEPAGPVEVVVDSRKVVTPSMRGRTYFANACTNGTYDHRQYAGVPLLGRTFRYTTNLTGADCGCNAALYLVSMRQNPAVSGCFDHYCDANSVCGVRCAEIDLQEANMHAWHSTLHVLDDGSGIGAGYGGGSTWNGHRDFTMEEYGPGAACIDTTQPFEVAISFPSTPQGRLQAMTTTLSQRGKPCNLTISVGSGGYYHSGRDGMAELSLALLEGMTPVISYWSSENMLWMDGPGADGRGPCRKDVPEACSQSVGFYDFSVEPMPGSPVSSSQSTAADHSGGHRRLRSLV